MYGVVSPDPHMYPASQAVNPIDYGVAKAGILQLVRYQAVQLASAERARERDRARPIPDSVDAGAGQRVHATIAGESAHGTRR